MNQEKIRKRQRRHKGLFISFEGIDGCGKTTHIRFLREALEKRGLAPIFPREPGGTGLGEGVRDLLLHRDDLAISAKSELLLFLASRAQICHDVIGPALQEGALVICDRFMDSSVAYQGYGRGLGAERVAAMNRFAVGDVIPDLTILLELDPALSQQRLAKRGAEKNRLDKESLDFMQRTHAGYLAMAAAEPDRFFCVPSDGDKDSTAQRIREEVWRFLA